MEQPLIHNVDTVYIETSHTKLVDDENVLSMTSTIIPNTIGDNTHNSLVPNSLCNLLKFEQNSLNAESQFSALQNATPHVQWCRPAS